MATVRKTESESERDFRPKSSRTREFKLIITWCRWFFFVFFLLASLPLLFPLKSFIQIRYYTRVYVRLRMPTPNASVPTIILNLSHFSFGACYFASASIVTLLQLMVTLFRLILRLQFLVSLLVWWQENERKIGWEESCCWIKWNSRIWCWRRAFDVDRREISVKYSHSLSLYWRSSFCLLAFFYLCLSAKLEHGMRQRHTIHCIEVLKIRTWHLLLVKVVGKSEQNNNNNNQHKNRTNSKREWINK